MSYPLSTFVNVGKLVSKQKVDKKFYILELGRPYKPGCIFLMVFVFILPHAKFGSNDYREDAPHFTGLRPIVLEKYEFLVNLYL